MPTLSEARYKSHFVFKSTILSMDNIDVDGCKVVPKANCEEMTEVLFNDGIK
jgi:hypothetical protein